MNIEPRQAESNGLFPTTQWTQIVQAARDSDPAAVHRALESFCLEYSAAIVAFLIWRGCTPADAQDLAQEFLSTQVLRDWDRADTLIHRARRESGHRFRSFLGTALANFHIDWQRASMAIKRGGGKVFSFDDLLESETQIMAPSPASLERQFDLAYARAILERATQSLRHCDQNLALLYRRKTQAEVAAELGMTENAVKQMHHQFRQRLGTAIRVEVERTVGPNPAEVDEEIRYLMSLFGELA